MKNKIFILAGFLATTLSIYAQSPSAYFEKISEAYEKKGSFKIQLSGEIKYTDPGLNKRIGGLIVKGDGTYYSEILNKEVIRDAKMDLYVDHSNKVILCKKGEEMDIKNDLLPILGDSSYLRLYDFKVNAEKNPIEIEIIPKSTSTYRNVYLFLDKETMLITNIHYLFNTEKNSISEFILNYKYSDTNQESDRVIFDVTRYVNTSGKLSLQKKYSSYKLINDYDKK